MNHIRILPKKCAAFRVRDGAVLLVHEIRPADRMILQDAPAWIQDDPLFGWMVADGSLEMVETARPAAKKAQETVSDAAADREEQPAEEEPKRRGRKSL